MKMMDLINELSFLDFAPVSNGTDKGNLRFMEELPFLVHEYPSGLEKNGWTVPDSWQFHKAEIKHNGKLIYDGRKHPLGVVGYSKPFKGKLNLDQLKEHLFYSKEKPDSIVFHCTHFFRPSERDWGFCVPKQLYDSLPPGEYEIDLEVSSTPGKMKVLEFTLPGKAKETIFFHAHNCHPAQANDDLSGIAVGIELMKKIREMRERKYTYTLLISPELIGSYFWLDSLKEEASSNLKYGIMLKSVGNDAALKLQKSFLGDSEIDFAAMNVLRSLNPGFESGAFRRVYGNDETVFEAPGYEIPTISLTRYPFPEYHTSLDTPAILSEQRLEEALNVCLQAVQVLEKNVFLKRKFKGLLALSHPRYDLYQRFYNPAEKNGPSREEVSQWYYLMTDMFRYFEANLSVLEIAEKYRLPFLEVYKYFSKFQDKNLLEFVGEEK
jgi:aminopeptidase-like protein